MTVLLNSPLLFTSRSACGDGFQIVSTLWVKRFPLNSLQTEEVKLTAILSDMLFSPEISGLRKNDIVFIMEATNGKVEVQMSVSEVCEVADTREKFPVKQKGLKYWRVKTLLKYRNSQSQVKLMSFGSLGEDRPLLNLCSRNSDLHLTYHLLKQEELCSNYSPEEKNSNRFIWEYFSRGKPCRLWLYFIIRSKYPETSSLMDSNIFPTTEPRDLSGEEHLRQNCSQLDFFSLQKIQGEPLHPQSGDFWNPSSQGEREGNNRGGLKRTVMEQNHWQGPAGLS
ncbi:uncharacterized protein [Mobula birostris]|uniref:uncharacterized protein isoform X2 n=1 Tax=Mobula birostris TaxID=1983395 RepID=UPI003B289D05